MKRNYLTTSPAQTKKIGKILAEEILKTAPKKGAFIVGLEGELGGGKTTFLKGFAKGLGIRERILSPTFITMKRFEIKNSDFENFYHIDCYRTKKSNEILKLGLKKIISNPLNIVAIEWAEKIHDILPTKIMVLKFKFSGKKKREITLEKKE